MATRILVAWAVLTVSAPAAASVGDVLGFGSRASGLAGAATALADGFEATYYNPARVGGAARLSLGVLAGASLLDVNGARAPFEDPVGLVIGASSAVPLGGALRDRIHVGIGLFLLPDKIVREIGRATSQAFFPLFDNRTQRVVILPALAVRLHERVWIGAAANVLASLGGRIDVAEGPMRTLDARVTEDLLTSFAFNAGLSLKLHARWTLALTLRDEFSLPFFTNATTSFAGNQLEIDLRGRTLFEPLTWTLGNAIELTPSTRVSLDLGFKRWSSYPGPFVAVRGSLPVGIGDVANIPIAPQVPRVRFGDVFSARLGGEGRAYSRGAWGVDLRGGYAFETSPVPAQTSGATFLADGAKHTFAFGASLSLAQTFSIDAHFSALWVASSSTAQPAGASFARLDSGGALLSMGLVGSYFFR
jgi:hypothetical protein